MSCSWGDVRSTGGCSTLVTTDMKSFDGTKSAEVPATVTPLVNGPGAIGTVTTWMKAPPPAARESSAQRTVRPSFVQAPWLGMAETKFKAPASGNCAMTAAAEEGPRLVMVMVKIRLLPTATGSG